MGLYINPRDCSKEEWLNKYGKIVSERTVVKEYNKDDTVPVCLIDNGLFTAAGVADSFQEAKYFMQPDGRPKQWYFVDKNLVEGVLGHKIRIRKR